MDKKSESEIKLGQEKKSSTPVALGEADTVLRRTEARGEVGTASAKAELQVNCESALTFEIMVLSRTV